MKKPKWGYLGTETALNGLTDWLFLNTNLQSRRRMMNLIVQFGLENDLISKTYHINYDSKKCMEHVADIVAKQMNKNNPEKQKLFQTFTAWVLKQQL